MKIFEIIGIPAAPSSSGHFDNPHSYEPSVDKKKSKKEKEKDPKAKYTPIKKDRGTIVDIEV